MVGFFFSLFCRNWLRHSDFDKCSASYSHAFQRQFSYRNLRKWISSGGYNGHNFSIDLSSERIVELSTKLHWWARQTCRALSRLAQPLQHQRTLPNGEMQIVDRPRKEGPLKNVMPLSHGGKSIVQEGFERYCRMARETDKVSSKESLM